VVDAVDVGVLGGGDLHLSDGEALLVRAARKLGAAAGADRTSDALVLESALGQSIPLAEAVRALEAGEVEAAIVGEAASGEVLPVEAALLVIVTLVVGVGDGVVRRSIVPGESGSSLLDGEAAGNERGRGDPHDGVGSKDVERTMSIRY